MRKYGVEFIGTFFLVLTVGMTVIEPSLAPGMAPLAIAGVLAAMIYAGGHVSGAHYNPAVTLAVTLRGGCTSRDALAYVLAQLLAGAVAAGVVLWFKQTGPGGPLPSEPVVLRVLVGETLFTFALAYVVLNVATAKGTSGNSYFGIAIGLVVLAGAYALGPIAAGALNPAVTLGAAVMGLIRATDSWMYLAGQLLGAALAAGVFKAINRD
jgi:aquaporin Z